METNKKGKHAGGRPMEYTKEVGDILCEQLAQGKSLRTVCSEEDMPAMSTVFRWMRTFEEFRNQYARAKEEATDALAEEIIDISDENHNDWETRKDGKGNEYKVVNNEAVQRSRLRVDTRKWIMSKMKPKKYGDKTDITSDGKSIQGNTIVFTNFKNETDSQ